MMILIAIALLIAGLITFFYGFGAGLNYEVRSSGFVYVWQLPVGGIVAFFALCWLLCMFIRWLLS